MKTNQTTSSMGFSSDVSPLDNTNVKTPEKNQIAGAPVTMAAAARRRKTTAAANPMVQLHKIPLKRTAAPKFPPLNPTADDVYIYTGIKGMCEPWDDTSTTAVPIVFANFYPAIRFDLNTGEILEHDWLLRRASDDSYTTPAHTDFRRILTGTMANLLPPERVLPKGAIPEELTVEVEDANEGKVTLSFWPDRFCKWRRRNALNKTKNPGTAAQNTISPQGKKRGRKPSTAGSAVTGRKQVANTTRKSTKGNKNSNGRRKSGTHNSKSSPPSNRHTAKVSSGHPLHVLTKVAITDTDRTTLEGLYKSGPIDATRGTNQRRTGQQSNTRTQNDTAAHRETILTCADVLQRRLRLIAQQPTENTVVDSDVATTTSESGNSATAMDLVQPQSPPPDDDNTKNNNNDTIVNTSATPMVTAAATLPVNSTASMASKSTSVSTSTADIKPTRESKKRGLKRTRSQSTRKKNASSSSKSSDSSNVTTATRKSTTASKRQHKHRQHKRARKGSKSTPTPNTRSALNMFPPTQSTAKDSKNSPAPAIKHSLGVWLLQATGSKAVSPFLTADGKDVRLSDEFEEERVCDVMPDLEATYTHAEALARLRDVTTSARLLFDVFEWAGRHNMSFS